MAFRELTALKADAIAEGDGVAHLGSCARGQQAQRVSRTIWVAMSIRKSMSSPKPERELRGGKRWWSRSVLRIFGPLFFS
jgi:hypothetical protein